MLIVVTKLVVYMLLIYMDL